MFTHYPIAFMYRGWRPSYRNVLLDVRKELKISCSTKLSTEDLEVEIFIHLLKECSRYKLLTPSNYTNVLVFVNKSE